MLLQESVPPVEQHQRAQETLCSVLADVPAFAWVGAGTGGPHNDESASALTQRGTGYCACLVAVSVTSNSRRRQYLHFKGVRESRVRAVQIRNDSSTGQTPRAAGSVQSCVQGQLADYYEAFCELHGPLCACAVDCFVTLLSLSFGVL